MNPEAGIGIQSLCKIARPVEKLGPIRPCVFQTHWPITSHGYARGHFEQQPVLSQRCRIKSSSRLNSGKAQIPNPQCSCKSRHERALLRAPQALMPRAGETLRRKISDFRRLASRPRSIAKPRDSQPRNRGFAEITSGKTTVRNRDD